MSGNAGLALLILAFRAPLDAPDSETGIATMQGHLGGAWDHETLRQALADQAHAGLLREPLRLSERSLHCSWRLELTPAGHQAARALLNDHAMTPDEFLEHLRSET